MPTKGKRHVAVNTRLLLGNRLEGIGRFAHEMLWRMVTQNPEVHFSFLFDRPWDTQFIYGDNVTAYHVPPPSRHPLLWYLSLHGTLPLVLSRLRPDAVFSPEFFLPDYSGAPGFPVFHDLGYEHFPADIPWLARKYYEHFSPQYARHAKHIFTVSDFSKKDIVAQYGTKYGITPEKITVVHNGSGGKYGPINHDVQEATRAAYTQGAPFFLYVGAIQPRKNIGNLLLAFDTFKTQTGSPVKMVIAGRAAWEASDTFAIYQALHHRDDVILTGYLPDEELRLLYGSALALTFVPRFEGFGIPALEAMYAEIPVLCSNSTSLPEVVGDAALLVTPEEVASIAAGMVRLWQEPLLRDALVARGRVQREQFSWDISYERLWQVLERETWPQK